MIESALSKTCAIGYTGRKENAIMRKRNIYTMAELQAALTAAFNAANRSLFDGELEKVVITVKQGQHKHAFGWITCEKTWIQGKEERHEINISADFLSRPVVEVMCTLVHEMCHLYNMMHGIQDCSRSGVYHNTKFRDCAENHLLICSQEPNIGWGRTTPSNGFEEWVKGNILVSSFRIHAKLGKEGGQTKKPSSTRKYECPECGCTCRATKDIKLICGQCYEDTEELVYMTPAG